MDNKTTIDEIMDSLRELKNEVQMKTYIPEHFGIKELVDPKTYQDRGIKAFQLLDPYMLWTLDRLRERFGSITINNWAWGGNYQFSGFRPKSCSIGSFYSQHRMGRGFDLKFKDYPDPSEVREFIRENPDEPDFKYINCVEEDTPTWLHIDGRPIEDRILWVNP